MTPSKRTIKLALETAIKASPPRNRKIDPNKWQKEQNKLIDTLKAKYLET
jgi:hypothetical protein